MGFNPGDAWLPASDGNGTIYLPAHDNWLVVALCENDGSVKWNFSVDDCGNFHSIQTLVNDELIYVTAGDDDCGQVFAIQKTDGSLIWNYSLPSEGFLQPSVDGDGTVFVRDDDLLALDGRSGSLKWRFSTGIPEEDFNLRALGTDGVVYVHTADNYTSALKTADGSLKLKFKTDGYGHPWMNPPMLAPDGTVVLWSRDTIYALPGEGPSVLPSRLRPVSFAV